MSNDVKAVRKVARCISTLLENEGVNVSATTVMEMIKDKDLSDINNLKVEVFNDMREKSKEPKAASDSSRRQRIETFMVSNWSIIKDQSEIKDALINAYCQGRYNKEQRNVMKNSLMSHCDPNAVVVEEQNVSEEVADGATEALAGALMGGEEGEDSKQDF